MAGKRPAPSRGPSRGLGGPVRIEGLKEVQRALKDVGDVESRELKVALVGIAEAVAKDARHRVPTVTGAARASIKAGAQMKGAYVQGGKKTVPYYGWLDFGTRAPISGRARTVGPWKGSGKGPRSGRFIYAAVGASWRTIEVGTRAAIDAARRRAGI